MDGSRAEPKLIAVTVVVLSELKRIVWPCQPRPHKATMTRTSSLAVILVELRDLATGVETIAGVGVYALSQYS